MVEEIRTLLLNSDKFKNYVFFPENYSERRLSKVLIDFRDALLKLNESDTDEIQAWRAKKIVNLLYEDRKLKEIVLRFFDKRKIQNDADTNKNFDTVYSISINHPNLIINSRFIDSTPDDGIYFKKISFTKNSNTSFMTCLESGIDKVYETMHFTFDTSGGSSLSDLKSIPGTKIKIGFSGTQHIPSDINSFYVTIKYPFVFDFNKIIEKVYSIGSIEQIISNKSNDFDDIYSVYVSSNRPYQKVLCLLIAYALSIK